MPQRTPGTSYTGKPVRRLKLPKIGPAKTKNIFEEHVYVLLAVAFVVVTILGKAGGFSTYNAVVIGAWVTAILWCAHQLKDYFVEKSKAENGKTPAPQPQSGAEAPKEPSAVPPNMKPMIGPQWPVKASARPSWPKLPKEQPAATATETSLTNSNEKKRAFVYERPTLPDRKPKMPNNWVDANGKNQKDKKRDGKKPKR